jgi:hypothetical protein
MVVALSPSPRPCGERGWGEGIFIRDDKGALSNDSLLGQATLQYHLMFERISDCSHSGFRF